MRPCCQNGVLSSLRKLADLPEGVTPRARDNFDGMKGEVFGHPPDRSPADAEQLGATLLILTYQWPHIR
jgi:hypothetical protein